MNAEYQKSLRSQIGKVLESVHALHRKVQRLEAKRAALLSSHGEERRVDRKDGSGADCYCHEVEELSR